MFFSETRCSSSGVVQICSATIGIVVEDILIKDYDSATCLCKMFSERRRNVTWTENSDEGNWCH